MFAPRLNPETASRAHSAKSDFLSIKDELTMQQQLKKIHVIFKTHLDIGFTDFAARVVDSYFEDFIPRALHVSRTLRETDSANRFVWTTGSWLIYEYLERASAQARAQTEDAIVRGDIVWHGLPFTTHSELMDADLFRFGLSLSQKLDQRYGKQTIAAKMTDVPGHTRGIVPLLAEAGIRFLHIGVNPASTVPSVPPTFVWKDEQSGADVVVMYHDAYGDFRWIDGTEEAIIFAHTGDNLGPQRVDEVQDVLGDLRQASGVEVVASTLDAYAWHLLGAKSNLPIVTGEIGDTWIHGVGTDTLKVSRFLELQRLRREWMQSEDPRDLDAFSRCMLMVPEHTWGMDVKTHLAEYESYGVRELAVARSSPAFRAMETSWLEQRAYVDAAVAALPERLQAQAHERLEALTPVMPTFDAYARLDAGDVVEAKHFTARFAENGTITQLTHKGSGLDWADAAQPLMRFWFEAFSEADYERFFGQYVGDKPDITSWSVPDFTKPGLGMAVDAHFMWQADGGEAYTRTEPGGVEVLFLLNVPPEIVQRYGFPAVVTLVYSFPDDAPDIHVKVSWLDKPAARLAQAAWLSVNFRPDHMTDITLEKLGTAIDPLDVVHNGNRHLHAIQSVDLGGRLRIEPLDSPLVAPGKPSLLDFNNDQPDLRDGLHFNLYNNVWGTNFPMWYEDNAQFRFVLRFTPEVT